MFAILKRESNAPISRERSVRAASRTSCRKNGSTFCLLLLCNNSSRVFEDCRASRSFCRIPRRSRSLQPSFVPPNRNCWQRTRTESAAPRTRSPASRTNRSSRLVSLSLFCCRSLTRHLFLAYSSRSCLIPHSKNSRQNMLLRSQMCLLIERNKIEKIFYASVR